MSSRLLFSTLVALALVGTTAARAEDLRTWHSDFAWQGQWSMPLRDFKERMDAKPGLGLGVQWTHWEQNAILHRTRLEWTVYRQSEPVKGVQTEASAVVLSFDRIFHFHASNLGPYILGGLGAVRWTQDQTSALGSDHLRTTKLNITAGLGWRFTPHISMETRYQASSLRRTMDGNRFDVAAAIHY